MFDETKDIWIKIYKAFVIIMFFATIIAGLVVGAEIADAGGAITGLIAGFIVGFLSLAGNMLILNLLENIQLIRQNVEKSNTWRCVCGAINHGGFCTRCGKPKP